MKVHLAKTIPAFQKSLENFLATIRSCQTGISFLAHCNELIKTLRSHPITSKWIKDLEQEIQRRNETFKLNAIAAAEEEWLTLWKSHKNHDSKKVLVQIKWFFTKKQEPSAFLPFEACYRLFTNFRIQFKTNLHSAKFIQFFKQNQDLQINDEKLLKEYIQTSTELDPVYFWDRLCLLERIYLFTASQPPLMPIQGHWEKIKFEVWDRATKVSSQCIYNLAKENLFKSFSGDGFSQAPARPSSLSVRYQFSRRECESHLLRLQANITEMLLRDHPDEREASVNLHKKKTKPEKKEEEVKKCANIFWKEQPLGKRNASYKYYSTHCQYKPYSFSEWERKIRRFDLDPRSQKEKTRGKSIISG